jgi:hypothetical protein
VSLAAAHFPGLPGFALPSSEGIRLAVLLAAGFVEALAEFAVFFFHLGQAAFQALVIPPEGLDFLG